MSVSEAITIGLGVLALLGSFVAWLQSIANGLRRDLSDRTHRLNAENQRLVIEYERLEARVRALEERQGRRPAHERSSD